MEWRNQKTQPMRTPFHQTLPSLGTGAFIVQHLGRAISDAVQIPLSFRHTLHRKDFVFTSGHKIHEGGIPSSKGGNHQKTIGCFIRTLRNLFISGGTPISPSGSLIPNGNFPIRTGNNAVSTGRSPIRTGGNATSTGNFPIRTRGNLIPTGSSALKEGEKCRISAFKSNPSTH